MKTELDPEDPVVRTAVTGKIVEDFLASEVGRLIAGHAQEQVDISTQKLRIVSPLRLFAVSRLQLEISLWEGLLTKLATVITDGMNATQLIEDGE